MECGEAKQLSMVVLAGDASEYEFARLAEHERRCPPCAVEGREVQRAGGLLAASTPAVLELQGDLVGEAFARTPDHMLRTPRALRWVVAPGVLAALGLALVLWPSRTDRLLAAVEAAAEAQWTHTVVTESYEGRGVTMRLEWWRAANGDVHGLRTFPRDPRDAQVESTWWWTERGLHWTHVDGLHFWELRWQPPRPELGELERRVEDELGSADLSRIAPESVRRSIALWRASGVKADVHERRDTLVGAPVRVVSIEAENAGVPTAPGNPYDALTIEFYLSGDGSRLLRQMTVCEGLEIPTFTSDQYPIEYDVEPPPGLFEPDIPLGATVLFGDRPVQPIWERWSDDRKQELLTAFDAMSEALARGDLDAFAEYCDFEAGLDYGVKTKPFIQEEFAHGLPPRLREELATWDSVSLHFSYALGSTTPPSDALHFWHIHEKVGHDREGWVFYRDQPTEEPGIIVLAMMPLTSKDRDEYERPTKLFLKELDGAYKIILWHPQLWQPEESTPPSLQ